MSSQFVLLCLIFGWSWFPLLYMPPTAGYIPNDITSSFARQYKEERGANFLFNSVTISSPYLINSLTIAGNASTPYLPLPPMSEMDALKDLFNSCNGWNWEWNGYGLPWDFSNDQIQSNPCSEWEGLMCSCNMTKVRVDSYYAYYGYYDDDAATVNDTIACNVVKIFLTHHNLQGSIPQSISKLRNLTHLHLFNNSITGTIPSSIFGPALQSLVLFGNSLTGSIPQAISDSIQLNSVILGSNLLTGSIPSSIAMCRNITNFQIPSNSLEGSLPMELSLLTNLLSLNIQFNMISGSLSPGMMASFVNLELLAVSSNLITGHIPIEIFGRTKLYVLFLSHNLFLPNQLSPLVFDLVNLIAFFCVGCSFTGTLSSSVMKLSALQILHLTMNSFTGSIPTSFGSLTLLTSLHLDSNMLTGSIPTELGHLTNMLRMNLNSNLLVSTIPSSLHHLTLAEFLVFSNNKLTGSLPSELFTPLPPTFEYAASLEIFDVSDNSISGSLPPSLFQLPRLHVFGGSDNCLSVEGSITEAICAATNMTDLFLDGLQSAITCREFIFPNIPFPRLGISSYPYTIRNPTQTSIPPCIFAMPNLVNLLVSGNGLLGNLGEVHSVTPTLTKLSLPHNFLTGSIPSEIQDRWNWSYLDLSFNMLGGTLIESMQLNADAYLNLQVNRLSGSVPTGLLELKNISLVFGNDFTCGGGLSSSSGLPKFDVNVPGYSCGSNEVNIALLVWGCTSLVFGIFYIFFRYYWGLQVPTLDSAPVDDINIFNRFEEKMLQLLSLKNSSDVSACGSAEPFGISSSITPASSVINSQDSNNTGEILLGTVLYTIRMFGLQVASGLCLLMIVYGVLKIKYGTYTFDYTYTTSLGHLSGVVPSVVSIVLCVSIVFLAHQYINSRFNRIVRSNDFLATIITQSETHLQGGHCNYSLRSILASVAFSSRLLFMGFLNVAVVVIINFAYVYTVTNSLAERFQLFFISFALSVFKVAWIWAGSRWLLGSNETGKDSNQIPELQFQRDTGKLSFLVSLTIINTIVVPIFAILLISPQCLYFVFRNPPLLITTYRVPDCLYYVEVLANRNESQSSTAGIEFSCASTQIFPQSDVVTSPFLYSYGCSFDILARYASVYVYLFLITTFIRPAVSLLGIAALRRCRKDSSAYKFLISVLPVYFLSLEDINQLPTDITPKTKASGEAGFVYINQPLTDASHKIDASGEGDLLGLQVPSPSPKTSAARLLSYPPSSKVKSAFNSHLFAIQMSQALSIIMSFGLIFPPLAFLGAIAVVFQTYFIQYLLRVFIAQLGSYPSKAFYLDAIVDDSYRLAILLKYCLWNVFPTGYFMLAIFIYDTNGIAGHNDRALDAPGVMLGIVVAIYFCCSFDKRNLRDTLSRSITNAYHILGSCCRTYTNFIVANNRPMSAQQDKDRGPV